jgi:hypothetical protein
MNKTAAFKTPNTVPGSNMTKTLYFAGKIYRRSIEYVVKNPRAKMIKNRN